MDADQLRDLWAEQAQEHHADGRQDAVDMYIEALNLLGEDTNTRYARSVIALRAAFYRDLLADIDRTDRPEGPPEMTPKTAPPARLHLVVRMEYADQQTLAAFTTEDAAQKFADDYNLRLIREDGACTDPARVEGEIYLDPTDPALVDA